jgi:hypothetical protein
MHARVTFSKKTTGDHPSIPSPATRSGINHGAAVVRSLFSTSNTFREPGRCTHEHDTQNNGAVGNVPPPNARKEPGPSCGRVRHPGLRRLSHPTRPEKPLLQPTGRPVPVLSQHLLRNPRQVTAAEQHTPQFLLGVRRHPLVGIFFIGFRSYITPYDLSLFIT